MAGGDFAAKKFPDARKMLFRGCASRDGSAAGREFIEDGHLEIAVEREGKRAGDGSSRQDEDVRRIAVARGFVHQALALEDAEAVLFVNGDKSEAVKFDVLLDEGVRADDELGFAGTDALARGAFFGGFKAADEQFHGVATGSEDAPSRKEMLDGENFRGGHERGLAAVFDGDDRSLERNDGFAAADIALQKAIHGHGLFEVRGNFGKDALLGVGRLERKDAFQGFADFIFANAKGDGVFLADGPAAQSQAQLVQEKLLENEALLGRRTKEIERFEGFAGVGNIGIQVLQRGVNGAANLARTKSADSFVDGNDAAHLDGIHLFAGKHFNLGIDHLAARGTELIDFDFAVEDELLAGLQASFQITAVEELAGQRAGIILNEEMIDGIAAVHAANGLAAHDTGAQSVGAVGLDVLDLGEMDAVFVAEGKIMEQIFKRVDAALGEEFGALRPNAFHHADVG